MRRQDEQEEEKMLKKRADICIEANKGPKHFEQCALGEEPSKVMSPQPRPYLLPPYGVPLHYRYYGAGYALGLVEVSNHHQGMTGQHYRKRI